MNKYTGRSGEVCVECVWLKTQVCDEPSDELATRSQSRHALQLVQLLRVVDVRSVDEREQRGFGGGLQRGGRAT